MKRPLLSIVAVLALAVSAPAVDVISSGTVFRECEQFRVVGAELQFRHESGTAHIRYDKLPEALVKKYFTPQQLAALREQEASAAEALRVIEANRAEEVKRKAAEKIEADRIAAEAKKRQPAPLSAKEYLERELRKDPALAAHLSLTPAERQFAAAEETFRRKQQGLPYSPTPIATFTQPTSPAINPVTASAPAAKATPDAEKLAIERVQREKEQKAMQERMQARAAEIEWDEKVNSVFRVLWIGIVSVLGLGLYFLPAFVGRHKTNAVAIFVLNLFLGWTFLGWVIALVWACTKDPETAAAG